MRKYWIVFVLCFVLQAGTAVSSEKRAGVYIDASVVVNKFKPYNIFGNNVNGWSDSSKVKEKIEAAGNFILRYPGGSWGDAFFWNTKGEFDKNGDFIPSTSEFSCSTTVDLLHVSHKALDKDSATYWLSHADTDFPDSQWIYIDLKEKKNPDRIEINWGDTSDKKLPYAIKFIIQYWDAAEGRQWMPYGADKDAWLDTSAGVLSSGGGKQEVRFDAVRTQYIRVLMNESSAGKGGGYSVAEIKLYEGGNDITPADEKSAVSSTCSAAAKMTDCGWIWDFEKYMTFINSFKNVKAEPLIIVNVGSGTPQMAAAWVKYANKIKNYGIKYWEVGNENGGQWEHGGPLNVYDYTRRFIKFYEAMKAVDPSITIIVQGQSDGNSQNYDGKSHITALLERLHKEGKTHYVEGLVTHQYPNWGQHVDELLASPKADMEKAAKQIDEALKTFPKLKNTPIWFTEFNTSDQVKPYDISVRLENGLWLAQYMPEFIRHFGNRGYMNLWDVMNGGSAIHKPDGGDHGYLQAEPGPYQYQERADYWVMKMMTNYWSAPGDTKEHKLVKCETADPMLAAYANIRPDGSLTLLVVNKSKDSSVESEIKVTGYKTKNEAVSYVFDKECYNWSTKALPYHADPSKDAVRSVFKTGADGVKFEFKPYSVTVIQL